MSDWFRVYDEDEGLWRYFEVDGEGWTVRQVEVRESDAVPMTAASLEEVLSLRDHGDLGAMSRYERRYGVLAEGGLDGWREQPHAREISAREFDRLWADARRTLALRT